jgi:hypothetical protein
MGFPDDYCWVLLSPPPSFPHEAVVFAPVDDVVAVVTKYLMMTQHVDPSGGWTRMNN